MTKSASNIIDKLLLEFKKPENYFKFLLGVLSQFITEVGTIYPAVKSVANEFSSCFEDFTQEKTSNSVPQVSNFENNFKTPQARKDYCLAIKEQISKNYVDSHKEHHRKSAGLILDNPIIGWASDGVTHVGKSLRRDTLASVDELCTFPVRLEAPTIQKEIKAQFSTFEEYKKQCFYFHSKNCDDFNPETAGLTDFAKKAYGFYKSIIKAGKCVGVKINDPANVAIKDVRQRLAKIFNVENVISGALTVAVNFAANIMTFGIWGGVKGGYYLVQLGLQIKEFWDNPSHETAYTIGQIVGKAILIVKSIIMGKRRFKKK